MTCIYPSKHIESTYTELLLYSQRPAIQTKGYRRATFLWDIICWQISFNRAAHQSQQWVWMKRKPLSRTRQRIQWDKFKSFSWLCISALLLWGQLQNTGTNESLRCLRWITIPKHKGKMQCVTMKSDLPILEKQCVTNSDPSGTFLVSCSTLGRVIWFECIIIGVSEQAGLHDGVSQRPFSPHQLQWEE